jgi:serine phosphatase RsbU (regulator of sigma subunit)
VGGVSWSHEGTVSAGLAGSPASRDERLSGLLAVTDTALAHLTLEELLDELLLRVRQFLSVDTAAVLLLDPSHQFLIATAAHGIEEEVHQGVRVPVGKGFAGRIAKESHWVVLDRVDETNVYNPILREKGIHSLLGVPLLAAGDVLGVLHVGSLTPRRFTRDDAALLQAAADRIALAVQAQMSRAERATAEVLQRNLLPTALPVIPGVELAARYVPCGSGAVGGDWYDVFTLPSGSLCLVVGDVVGHGLTAAQQMHHMRTALRAYATDDEDPAKVLSKLSQYVAQFQTGTMATVACAVFNSSLDLVLLSSAGHPPPILGRPGHETTILAVPPDLPLGIEPTRPRRVTRATLGPGAVLCLYTDGLFERKSLSPDAYLELLRASITPQSAESVCVSVMGNLVGADVPQDDVALLVLYRQAGRF